jgi:GxxExxY protein
MIIGAALQIHRDLGAGLFESVYREILADQLSRNGLAVETERIYPLMYHGRLFDKAFRVDMTVNEVLVEVKSITQLAPIHHTQLLTYLRLANARVGLLLNFGEASLRIKRIAN